MTPLREGQTSQYAIKITTDDYKKVVDAIAYSLLKSTIDEACQKVVPGLKALGQMETTEFKFILASAMGDATSLYKTNLVARSDK